MEVVSVDDPRPLRAAVDEIEQRCRCVITYEDPTWEEAQVVDISGIIEHRPEVRPHVPRGGPLTFAVEGIASSSPHQLGGVIRAALAAAEQNGYGAFQLVGEDVYHVVPGNGSVLAAPVTFAARTAPVGDLVQLVLSAVVAATGRQVVIATGPINLMRRPVAAEANQEAAGTVLSRVLRASGRDVSWRLLYDFGMKKYFLNLHVVE
jgi:hypothetical protein